MSDSRQVSQFSLRISGWILAGILIAMPVWPFLSTWFGSITGANEVWKSAPAVMIAVVASLLFLCQLVVNRKALARFFSVRIVILTLLFLLIVLVSAFLNSVGTRAKLAGLAMDGRYLIAFLIAYFVAQNDGAYWRQRLTKLPDVLIWIGVGLAFIGVLQVFILPADFLTHFGYSAIYSANNEATIAASTSIDNTSTLRAFATLRGPNDYGAYLIIPLVLSIAKCLKARESMKRIRYALAGVTIGAGLLLSSSRSAWLAAVLSVSLLFVLLASDDMKNWLKQNYLWLVFGALALLPFIIIALENPYVRLNILHIDENRASSKLTSNDAHTVALGEGVKRITAEPLGCGVGCAGPASFYNDRALISENYYLQIAESYGLVGGMLWLAIFAIILWHLYRQKRKMLASVWFSAGIGCALIGFFLHVFADEPLALTWFIVAGALIGLPGAKLAQK